MQFIKAQDSDIDDGSWAWSLGLDHKFSKRTKVYAGVGQLKQANEGRYFLGGGHNTNTFNTRQTGEDQTAVTLGMVHKF